MKLSLALHCALLVKLSSGSFTTDSSDRIAFGSKAKQGEFPFAVPILWEIKQSGGEKVYRFFCTAHCIHKKNPRRLSVYLGHADISAYRNYSSVESKYKYGVRQVIPHPHYGRGGFAFSNDIGLMKLSRTIDLTTLEAEHLVSKVCLPTVDEPPQPGRCLILGWGRNEHENLSDDLLKVAVKLVHNCPLLFNPKQVYCAVGATQSGNTCPGDSGGPLLCAMKSNPTVWVQYGVTSYGLGVVDCRDKKHSYETKVNQYLEWIIKHAGA